MMAGAKRFLFGPSTRSVSSLSPIGGFLFAARDASAHVSADEILRELPRSTKIGPPVLPKALVGVRASWVGRIDSLDLWVPRFSFKEIDLADSMVT